MVNFDGHVKSLFASDINQFWIKMYDVPSVKNFKLFEEPATSF
jgi:hypothetical protein